MGSTVREYMNPQLVYVCVGVRPRFARQHILDFGVTAVPILDDDYRPVGMLSLRDLLDPVRRESGATGPVHAVTVDDPLAAAAHKLAEHDLHHLVVVDTEGRAVGMLSSLDILRGLIGLEPKHPVTIDAFGHTRVDANALDSLSS
jgi:CBS domain-containing protein